MARTSAGKAPFDHRGLPPSPLQEEGGPPISPAGARGEGALPPGTPDSIIAAYRQAFGKMSADPEFLERGRAMSEDFVTMPHGEVARLVHKLGDTPPDAISFIDKLYKKQGLLPE